MREWQFRVVSSEGSTIETTSSKDRAINMAKNLTDTGWADKTINRTPPYHVECRSVVYGKWSGIEKKAFNLDDTSQHW